jgi:hypothetical protein
MVTLTIINKMVLLYHNLYSYSVMIVLFHSLFSHSIKYILINLLRKAHNYTCKTMSNYNINQNNKNKSISFHININNKYLIYLNS